jgi:hypothetical protein
MRDESTEDTTKYERYKKNSREKLIVTDKVIVRTKTQKVSPAWAAYLPATPDSCTGGIYDTQRRSRV